MCDRALRVRFSEIVKEATILLQEKGRVTYRALKREFDLEEDAPDDLKEELLYTHPEVADDAGRRLIWNGAGQSVSAPPRTSEQPQSPATYTP